MPASASRSSCCDLAEMSQAQRERLSYLEMHLWFSGAVRRPDIESRFGVTPAAASRDLAAYRELAPCNLEYDTSRRCYRVAPGFKPIFAYSTERVLAWLTQGFGDGLDLKQKRLIPSEGPSPTIKPALPVLAAIAQAIAGKRILSITYLSLSSGRAVREIAPITLADSGMRWHVRAYDRLNQRFSDFVLRRIAGAEVLKEAAAGHERLEADTQWARMVDLELVPHPNAEWHEGIEADYAMENGCLNMCSRAALVGYLLQRWSVDCTADHQLNPKQHPLWLSNPQSLDGVESAILAPGYHNEAAA